MRAIPICFVHRDINQSFRWLPLICPPFDPYDRCSDKLNRRTAWAATSRGSDRRCACLRTEQRAATRCPSAIVSSTTTADIGKGTAEHAVKRREIGRAFHCLGASERP